MKAFNDDEKLKKDLLKEIKKHEKADEIAQGSYAKQDGKKMKLCAVGCALYSLNAIRNKHIAKSDHSAFEPELGIPKIIAKMTDCIFEGLPIKEAKTFPYEFVEAIPVGADLKIVWKKFMLWLLMDGSEGVIRFAKTERTKKAITDVGNLFTQEINGEAVEPKIWKAAAAAYAAYAAARQNARFKAYHAQKEKLLELLRECK